MAADQDRADRIRSLKQARPDLTWRRIADAVGVTERSATDWQVKGGISYENARKLAVVFEVDVDYIWRGTESTTPRPFADGSTDERLDRIEAALTTMLERVDHIAAHAQEQRSELMDRLEALETAILHNGDVVADRAVDKVRDIVKQPDEVTRAIEALAAELHADADQTERAATPGRRAAPRRPVRAAK
jgi:hypothetical protein